MSSTASSFERKPLVISGNNLWSGTMSTTFPNGDPNALLRTYLTWVRDMRGQQRASAIQLRSEDVAVIASHLGIAEDTVLGGLLDLMGATRTGRSTMMALLAAGALTVVLSGVSLAQQSDGDLSLELGSLVDAVQSVVQRASTAETGATAEAAGFTVATAEVANAEVAKTAAPTAAAVAPAADVARYPAVAPVTPTTSTTRPDAALAAQALTDEQLIETILSASEALAARRLAAAEQAATAAQAAPAATSPTEPVATGTGPDGSTVAVVAPPVAPPVADEPVAVGTAPDGSTVAVATPPVPPAPAEPVATGTAPDGSTVGVAAPPVPPPTGD